MTIAKKIDQFISASSWIRKMFEEGSRLKATHGSENVFDFSLGNPNIPPPPKFDQSLMDAAEANHAGVHSYMPNTGYPEVRQAVAAYLSREQQTAISENEIIMTCGAAGALNVILKTLLNPGDEIITPAPYFVEYRFYADNHGGKLITVPTNDDFNLNLNAIQAAINARTKVILINSPNNPTGQIYSQASLLEVGKLLKEKSAALGHTIYLIADEPYRKIIYDDAVVPGIFNLYPESMICTSYSKDLSIPGERMGFLAISPNASARESILNGAALANRILGFVNAPALMQRAIASLQGTSVDIEIYQKKRDLLCEGLKACGYEFERPQGAFYLFPKAPLPDDVEFVRALQKELILAVPGSGFGGPGYFRLAYCVDDQTIIKALPIFRKVIEAIK